MKKLLLSLSCLWVLSQVFKPTTGGLAWDKAPNKVNDMAALQNGAKLFVNYCLNCHSAAYMRYNRLKDIGLTEAQIKENLLFATDKVGETMKAAIDPKQAKDWFGANPPDLTVIARSRAGAAVQVLTICTLTCVLITATKPKQQDGIILAMPNVAMPHVLWELQGERKPIFNEVEEHGHKVQVFSGNGSRSSLVHDAVAI